MGPMAKVRHLLTEIDEDEKHAFCSVCDTLVKIVPTGKYKADGSIYWRCRKAYKIATLRASRPWRLYKGTECVKCGFVALHPSQLHVDHIDGDGTNNDPINFQTLCANCHAYKTAMNNEWMANKFSPSALS
jgi:hypothetical protein